MHILVVEDQDLYRQALAKSLLELSQATIISEADSVQSTLKIISEQHHKLNLIILDYGLPDGNGLDLLIEIKNHHPTLAVAILSASHNIELMQQALDAGAHGFIPKTTPRPILLSAIKLILAGGIYISPELYAAKPTPQSTINTGEFSGLGLTIRQGEVMALICSGLSNKAIAYRLNITEATVKAHVTAILKYHGVSSRTQLLSIHRKP